LRRQVAPALHGFGQPFPFQDTTTMRIAAAVAFTAALALTGAAQAATITGLFNTGVDDGGALLVGDVADAHWTLDGGAPAYTGLQAGQFPEPYWMADGPNSRWLTPSRDGGQSYDPFSEGTYNYTLNFTLPQFSAASFSGAFAADNEVSAITLNGHSLGGGVGFSGWTGFSAASGDFVSGTNTLTFTVKNWAQNGGNPTGLRVEFGASNVTAAPEPGMWALMLLGFGGVGATLRAQRRRMAALA
jgi:hypothetical protein